VNFVEGPVPWVKWVNVNDRLPTVNYRPYPSMILSLGDLYKYSYKVILCIINKSNNERYVATGRAIWVEDEFHGWVIDLTIDSSEFVVTHWAVVKLPELDGAEDD
jgi:hypothetical protein